MSARDRIFERLKANRPSEHPLPPIDSLVGTRFDDLTAQFCAAVEAVAGSHARTANRASLTDLVTGHFPDARKILSSVPEVLGVSKPDTSGPADFEGIDLLVANGAFGVAENAAVWVDAGQFAHQSCLFLCQRLVLVVETRQIVHNMHEAYARLATADMPPFGVFVSGPSKTADIEQTLVIGAQAARSCHVILVDG